MNDYYGSRGIAARTRLRGQAAEPHRDSAMALPDKEVLQGEQHDPSHQLPSARRPVTRLPKLPRAPLPAPSTLPPYRRRVPLRDQNVETQGRYQVHIHAETMRIITEVVDMATGDVSDVFPAGLPSGREAGGEQRRQGARRGRQMIDALSGYQRAETWRRRSAIAWSRHPSRQADGGVSQERAGQARDRLLQDRHRQSNERRRPGEGLPLFRSCCRPMASIRRSTPRRSCGRCWSRTRPTPSPSPTSSWTPAISRSPRTSTSLPAARLA